MLKLPYLSDVPSVETEGGVPLLSTSENQIQLVNGLPELEGPTGALRIHDPQGQCRGSLKIEFALTVLPVLGRGCTQHLMM